MSTVIHYGIKGMRWGVRKKSISIESKGPTRLSEKSVPIAGSGGGEYVETFKEDDSVASFAKELDKTVKESSKMIKMGAALAVPVMKKLGNVASNAVKEAARLGKSILKKLNSVLSEASKKVELEYNKQFLTKEEKRSAVKSGWEKAKKKRIADAIRRDRYS